MGLPDHAPPLPPVERPPARTVVVAARTVAIVFGILIALVLGLYVLYTARRVITWVLIAVFLSLALNPAVEFFERRGLRHALAVALVFTLALATIALVAFLLVPPIVRQVRDFVDALPSLTQDLTRGRGPLGFLERDYHVVERVRKAVQGGGGGGTGGALKLTTPLVSLVTTFVTAIVGAVTIAFLTLFMLLEGPAWVARFEAIVPEATRPHWQRGMRGVYRTVGGYVTGNIAISVIAGVATTLVLLVLGVPYAVALGLLVALLDLIPLAGATIAAILVAGVAFAHGLTAGIVAMAFFVVYQQLENHVLQPIIYGRTVQLSPLAVLISVLIGAELLGVIGALAAIPVGGSLQVIGREVALYRSRRPHAAQGSAPPAAL